jgi:hypothetical protein
MTDDDPAWLSAAPSGLQAYRDIGVRLADDPRPSITSGSSL